MQLLFTAGYNDLNPSAGGFIPLKYFLRIKVSFVRHDTKANILIVISAKNGLGDFILLVLLFKGI